MGSFRNSLAWVDRMVEAGLEDLGTDCWADQLAPCSLGFHLHSHPLGSSDRADIELEVVEGPGKFVLGQVDKQGVEDRLIAFKGCHDERQ